jgi:hypothetical protein
MWICCPASVSQRKHYNYLIKNCPKLEAIELDSGVSSLTQNQFSKTTIRRRLPRLEFWNSTSSSPGMRVNVTPTTIFRYINFSSLTILHMLRCKRAAPFINALSAFYTRAPCKLKDLRVCLRKSKGDENDDVVQAIQSVLSCVSTRRAVYRDRNG